MKTLLEFVINQKIKNVATIDWPIYKQDGNYGYVVSGTRKIEVPNKPIVIYRDKYHKLLHLADFEDMLVSIGCWMDDFEDFSAKDIIASFDTFKEAAEYVLNDKGNRYYDHKDFLNSCIEGNEDDQHGTGSALPGNIDCAKEIINQAKESWDVTIKPGVKIPGMK